MKFSQFVVKKETPEEDRHLNVYNCPYCGKNEAYNGVPNSPLRFRGSAKCFACDKSFSAIGMKPVSTKGPLTTTE